MDIEFIFSINTLLILLSGSLLKRLPMCSTSLHKNMRLNSLNNDKYGNTQVHKYGNTLVVINMAALTWS